MDGFTHRLAGVSTASIAIIGAEPHIHLASATLLIIGGYIGGELPDFDKNQSDFSQNHKLLTILLNTFVLFLKGKSNTHRGISHTALIPITLYLINYHALTLPCSPIIQALATCGIGISLGYASHILLDLLTSMGVMFFYPFSKKFISIGNIKRKNTNTTRFIIILIVFFIWQLQMNYGSTLQFF